MKKVIVILITIMVSSCGVKESEMYQRKYSLKNESEQIIKLKFYLTHNNLLVEEGVILGNTDVFNGQNWVTDQPLSNNVDHRVSTPYQGSDSLIVIYNNQKKSTYTIDFNGVFSSPIERNPFRHGNYTNLGNDKFQFTFTEEDYENAENCNGNCE